MAILVTGGAGFIGSHVCDELLDKGEEVVCVDNLNSFYPPRIKIRNIAHNLDNPKFHFHAISIREKDKLEEIFNKHTFNSIIHLAARAGVGPSIREPLKYRETNVTGTLNLLQLAREQAVPKFVFASSSSVYGDIEKVPFHEDTPSNIPLSPYAASKRACEIFCANYSHICDMDITALRYFTVYGPRNRPDMAIYKFAKAIQNGTPITVYKHTKEGTEEPIKRDFTFIKDIVQGTISAMKKNTNGKKYEVLNLGNSTPVDIQKLVQLLEEQIGKKAIIQHAPLPIGDVPITYANTQKAQEMLGWKATTPIEEGIQHFGNWFKETHL